MISRTIGLIGLLASIMALSSLIYGVFDEPLYQYMQGVVGGIIDIYRIMRDFVFTNLGWALSALINTAKQWLTWVPSAPWFTLSGLQLDLLTAYLIVQGSLNSIAIPTIWHRWSEFTLGSRLILVSSIFLFPLWILLFFQGHRSLNARMSIDIGLEVWLKTLVYTLIGALIYFLIVFAENQIGL